MTTFDKGVILPASRFGGGRPGPLRDFPWADMATGDSVFLPGKTSRQGSAIAHSVRRHFGHEMSTRSVVEEGVKGVRLWCVESWKEEEIRQQAAAARRAKETDQGAGDTSAAPPSATR